MSLYDWLGFGATMQCQVTPELAEPNYMMQLLVFVVTYENSSGKHLVFNAVTQPDCDSSTRILITSE